MGVDGTRSHAEPFFASMFMLYLHGRHYMDLFRCTEHSQQLRFTLAARYTTITSQCSARCSPNLPIFQSSRPSPMADGAFADPAPTARSSHTRSLASRRAPHTHDRLHAARAQKPRPPSPLPACPCYVPVLVLTLLAWLCLRSEWRVIVVGLSQSAGWFPCVISGMVLLCYQRDGSLALSAG